MLSPKPEEQATGLQSLVVGAKPFEGQVGDEPVQFSATSQGGTAALQTMVLRAYLSVQVPERQVSLASHPPDSVAQIVPSALLSKLPEILAHWKSVIGVM
jgi:hypothetical protein